MVADYRLGRRPALTGVRGAAVLLVVVGHSLPDRTNSAGTVGVTVFFVLSGFLITRMLMEEKDLTGRLDLMGFWVRRAARLWPALFLFLVVFAVAGFPLWAVAAAALYVANLVGAAGRSLGWLGHTWSLALEEQFYVLWPVLVVIVRRRYLPFILLGTITAVEVWRTMLVLGGAPPARVTLGPDARVDAILAGCLLALLIARLPARRVASALFAPAAAVLVLCSALPEIELSAFAMMPVIIASLVLVMGVATDSWGARFLAFKPVVALGTISYGVYLWHYLPTRILLGLERPFWIVFAGAILFAVAAATLSWRLLEMPVQQAVRRRMARGEPRPPRVFGQTPIV